MNFGSLFGSSPKPMFKSFDMINKAQLSQSDLSEFKWLIRELRRVLRGGMFSKGLEDAEHDDERPTPNGHRLTTSSPTGATEVDPDDDPRYWAWRVFFGDRVLAYHESFLEVINEGR